MNNQSDQLNIESRTHHSLNNKQIAYLTARIQGKSKEESKRIAKYSANTSTTLIEQNPNMRQALLACMKNVGLTEDYLAEKLMQGTQAKRIQYFSKDGVVTDERIDDDGDLQHKFITKVLEVRNDIKSDQPQVNIGLIAIPNGVTVEDWNSELNKNEDNKLIDNSDGKSASINENK